MPKRPPLPPETLSSESERLCSLLNDANDFSAIVVAVSYIDACVGSLLAKRFTQSSVSAELLDSTSGHIGSFGARSKLAYALGLIGKPMFQDLMVLAEMRNEAAHHHLELTFDSEPIAGYCLKLKYVAGLKNGSTDEPLFHDSLLQLSRNRFMFTATMIVNRLLLIALETSHAPKRTA